MRLCHALALGGVVTLTALSLSPILASAQAASGCSSDWSTNGETVQTCADWAPGGTIPVAYFPAPGSPQVGTMRARGTSTRGQENWYACQVATDKVGSYRVDSYRNHWWALTLSDDGKTWGWVNAVYFKAGGNDQPVPGLAYCGSRTAPRAKAGGEMGFTMQNFGAAVANHRRQEAAKIAHDAAVLARQYLGATRRPVDDLAAALARGVGGDGR